MKNVFFLGFLCFFQFLFPHHNFDEQIRVFAVFNEILIKNWNKLMNAAENAFLAFYHLFVIHVPPMIAKHPMYLKGLQKDAFCNSGLPNLHNTAETYKIHLWRFKWPSMLKFAGTQTRRRVRHSVLGLSCLQQHCDLYLSLLEYLSGRTPPTGSFPQPVCTTPELHSKVLVTFGSVLAHVGFM